MAARVDDELRGRILIEGDFTQAVRLRRGHRALVSPRRMAGEQPLVRVFAAHLGEDALLQVHRRERAREVQQHFRPAQHEVAAIAQREVKPVDDARLCFVVEIHQRVAAHEQIHARDRRIVEQVVAAEDDRAAKVFLEDGAAAAAIEVLGAEALRQAFHLAVGVRRRPRNRQFLFVYVGGVNLHPLAELIRPEHLGEQDRHRVAFLARRAAGAPDPYRLVTVLVLQHSRDDLRAQVLERLRVAEKAGHVDEDGVEQLAELVRVHFEIVEDTPRRSRR